LHQLEPALDARAALVEARRCLDGAIEDHRAALRAEPGNLFYLRYLRNDHFVLALVLLRLGEPAASAVQAEELPRLFPASPDEHVQAARLLAESAARPGPGQAERARRAVGLLEKAVALGFRDAQSLRTAAYAPLRDRDDFRRLLGRLASP